MGFKQTNNYGIGDDNFTAFQETLDTTRRGLLEMSLSEYDTDAAPVVKVGSWFENNGSMYEVITGDETPTGYAGISNSTTFYLYYDVSGDEFIYDSTAPTWNDALQGWYISNDRALFSMYKDSGGTLYQNKALIHNASHLHFNKRNLQKAYSATAVAESVIFTALESWVPTTGKILHCEGHLINTAGDKFIINGLNRFSSTQVRILLLATLTPYAHSETGIDSGSANSPITIDIQSNYDEI